MNTVLTVSIGDLPNGDAGSGQCRTCHHSGTSDRLLMMKLTSCRLSLPIPFFPPPHPHPHPSPRNRVDPPASPSPPPPPPHHQHLTFIIHYYYRSPQLWFCRKGGIHHMRNTSHGGWGLGVIVMVERVSSSPTSLYLPPPTPHLLWRMTCT